MFSMEIFALILLLLAAVTLTQATDPITIKMSSNPTYERAKVNITCSLSSSFSCHGNCHLNFTWTVNGSRILYYNYQYLITGTHKDILVFRLGIHVQDRYDRYGCFVVNSGALYRSREVAFDVRHPFVIRRSPNLTYEHSKVNLICSPSIYLPCQGICSHNFVWTVNNSAIITNSLYLITGTYNNTLVFRTGIKMVDRFNRYRCYVVSGVFYFSQVVTLDVLRLPQVSIKPEFEPLVVPKGTDVNLTCSSAYSHPLSITWNLNGNQTGNIIITNIQKTIFVWCRITFFDNVFLDAYKTVNVQYPPSITPIADSFVSLGESVSVTCHVDAYPSASIWWQRPYSSNRIHNLLLTINIARKTDDGLYTCVASNTLTLSGKTPTSFNVSTSFTLHVQYGPKIIQNIHDISPLDGENVFIYCNASTHKPYRIYLEHTTNGFILHSSFNHLLEYTFYNISPEQSGIYRCIAYNTWHLKTGQIQEKNSYSSFHIGVLFGPEKTFELYSLDSVPIVLGPGDEKLVYCYSLCNPPCITTWYFPNGSFVNEKYLALNNSLSSGNYTCRATNIIGEATQYIEMQKQDTEAEKKKAKHFELSLISILIGFGAGVVLLSVIVTFRIIYHYTCKRKEGKPTIDKAKDTNLSSSSPLAKTKGSSDHLYMDLDTYPSQEPRSKCVGNKPYATKTKEIADDVEVRGRVWFIPKEKRLKGTSCKENDKFRETSGLYENIKI